MLKDVCENMEFSPVHNCGAAAVTETSASLDYDAAGSVKNVLFLFSLIFRYPREAVNEELGRLLPAFEDFFNAYADNAPGLPGIVDLQAEYIRLFVNGRGGVPAVPYASYHLDRGVLKGESYSRLRQIMEKAGFVLDESAGELEDHLAILLEFGSMLTDRLIRESASGEFLENKIWDILSEVIIRYLRPMMKPVMEGISTCAMMDFYTVSARALFNFIEDMEEIYADIFDMPMMSATSTGVNK
jgi:TorA maturation chaperone TorD